MIRLIVAFMLVLTSFTLARAEEQSREATLYKNPQCGCCEGYAEYLRNNGFAVTVKPTHELSRISREAGIPDDFQGCHTMFIDGYVIGGHVPVNTARKLLSERPKIKGITLPGMPLGSPGMSGSKTEPWKTHAIGEGTPVSLPWSEQRLDGKEGC